jgi:predicted DNA-binding protein YlxM (UPF0122 family)
MRPAHNLVKICPSLLQKKEQAMSDDKTKTGGQDRSRINVNEDYELRDWSKKFGVTSQELKDAVKKVGDKASAVEAHLKTRN